MSGLDQGRDPFEAVVSDALRARAATNVLPPDGLDQIHQEVARRRRRRRTTWLAAAALFVLFVGVAGVAAARSSSDDSAPFVGPGVTMPVETTVPEITVTTSPIDPDVASSGECVLPKSNGPAVETAAVEGNDGATTLDEMVRTIWPTIAGDLELVDIGPSSFDCSLTVATLYGGFTVSGHRSTDGLWYLLWVGPTEQDEESSLSVEWLTDGTLYVHSSATCADCVLGEVTAFAAGGSWVGRSGIPLHVEMQAPGSDGNRALLRRYFDSAGSVRSVYLTSISSGDFAAS
jgi:hypothetical protein